MAAVLLTTPAHCRTMLAKPNVNNITAYIVENIYHPCANAFPADDPTQPYGSTLYMLTPAMISADQELHRRVTALCKWSRPKTGCLLNVSPEIKKACREDADNTPPYKDRSDYEWHATCRYACPRKENFTYEAYQIGGGNDGLGRR